MAGLCTIVMTFTDTACDCAESLPIGVAGLKQIGGIEDVSRLRNLTWFSLPGRSHVLVVMGV